MESLPASIGIVGDIDVVTPALVVTRPAVGQYATDVLRMETRRLTEVGPDELLVSVLYLSIDPTNRNWLKLDAANTLFEKIGRNLSVGSVMVGEVLARVELSRSPEFRPGDVVAGIAEWQERAVVPAARMRGVDVVGEESLTTHLTVFSHVGLAAMVGLHEVARIQPRETVLVSAAAGATGRLAVGIAKAAGCTVIGIAGGTRKGALVAAAGADEVIDYRATDDLAGAIRAAAPQGIDAYFDNVGGAVLDAALLAMNPGGRVAICGVMSAYDAGDDARGVQNMFAVLIGHLRLEGFLAGHYWDRRAEYFDQLRALLVSGSIESRADEAFGLASAPKHLARLFDGSNEGKLIVRL